MHKTKKKLLIATLGIILSVAVNALAQEPSFPDVSFPNDTGMINVKTVYGAIGDGLTDDTEAIRSAIANNVGTHRTLFFPSGTYIVSDQIDWRNINGQWRSYLTLQGSGANRTIIKLRDQAPGFGDDAPSAKPVLRPGSKTDDPACSNYNRDNGDGGGNCAFNNYIFDLTINTGSGNPKAIGVDFIASNNGGMVNVKIISGDGLGITGLSLAREVGPALIKNLYVQGFNTGIYASRDLYGITFENITLACQRVYGLRNNQNTLSIRNLRSINAVPAVANTGDLGLITLIDSTLSGGAANVSAIVNSSSSGVPGKLFARNITTTGYQSAIQNGTNVVSGNSVSEFVSHPIRSLFDSPQQSLNLPIKETPQFLDNNLSNWANVENYGAIKNDGLDDTAGIQAAIDSGKATIYFPFGSYNISATLYVRGNVKRIVGFSSRFSGPSGTVICFENQGNIQLEKARFSNNIRLEHATRAALTAKYITSGTWRNVAPSNTARSGPYFFEDYCCTNLAAVNQDIWARQLNLEGSTPLAANSGGRLWILGLKTEGTRTTLNTTDGGFTELLGGMLYATGGNKSPAFINENSSMSLTFSEISYSSGANWLNYVQETRNGEIQTLARSAAQWRGLGGIMPLYVGYENASVSIPTISDAYVRDGKYATTNFGMNSHLHTKRVTGGADYNRHLYVKFDISGVSNFVGAKMRLYGQLSTIERSPISTALYSATNTIWGETNIRWNNKPAASATVLTSVGGMVADTTPRWYEWDISEFLKSEKGAGRNLVTLVLKNTRDSTALLNFNSKEATENQPELILIR